MSGTTGYIIKSTSGTVTAGNGLSGYFSESSYCTLTKSTEYDVSGGDWTFEFWFNWSKGNTMSSASIGIANNRRMVALDQAYGGWHLGFSSPDYPYDGSTLTNFFLSTDGGDISSSAFNATSIPQNTWHHIALVKNGSSSNNVTFYLDGVNVDVATAPTWGEGYSDVYFGIGPRWQYAGNPNMKISNFRLSAEAVYTGNFTPSTSPLSALPSTKILTFQSTFHNAGSTGGNINNLYNVQIVREGPWYTTGQQYYDFGDYFIRRDLVGLTVPAAPILEGYYGDAGYTYTWGYNGYGQIGNSTTTDSDTAAKYLSSTYKDMQPLVYANMAIKTDGTLWTWGRNLAGNLGIGNTDQNFSVSSPIQTIWGGKNWHRLAENNVWTTNGFGPKGALKTDGTLWLWGANIYGEAGGPTAYVPREVYGGGTNWKKARTDVFSTIGLKTDGTIWGWGYSNGDTLFSGGNTSIPIQLGSSSTDWADITTSYLVFAGIKTDGTLWTWGSNGYGQLGEGTTITTGTPQQVQGTWRVVDGGTNHMAGIKTDGTLWTWGRNDYGQLGDGTIDNKSSPVQTLAGGTDWKTVRCSNHSVYATKTDGSLWAWGQDVSLGDGTAAQTVSSPVMSSVGGWIKVMHRGIGLRSSAT